VREDRLRQPSAEGSGFGRLELDPYAVPPANRNAPRHNPPLPVGGLAGALVLFAINWFIAGKLASIEYLDAMHSIEGAYIAISRYAMRNWGDLAWFPLWYNGVPYQNSYPPLLHLVVAGFAWLLGWTPALSYHAVNAVLYCLAPVALFWLGTRWSGSRVCGFAAGLLYSLISPSAFLISNVAADLGGPLQIRRLQTLVFYGDGPFVASLALVPAALALLDLALERRRPLLYLAAAVSVASVFLTNWLGGATLALAVLAYLLGCGEPRRTWPAVAGIGALAYALASPWIPPSTIATIQFNAQTIGGDYHMTWRQAAYGLAAAAAVWGLHLLFRRLHAASHLRAGLYFVFLTGVITLSAEWGGLYLVPQPHRYHMAMDMALCLTAALLLQPLWNRIAGRGRWLAVGATLVVVAAQAYHLRTFAQNLIRPIDIRTTTEYAVARWFDSHMHGGRAMVPGAVSYYMNIFTDTPQLGGGFEAGVSNWENRVALYVLYTDQNAGAQAGEISVLWLKAFGVRAVAVGGPASGEHFKPFQHPRKFEGLLAETWRQGDDYIYSVPARSDSLAHIVGAADLVSTPPIHGLDVAELQRYVAALEDPELPLAPMNWTSRHSARIVAEGLRKDRRISVQVTYHPGWRATVGGVPRPVGQDGIGLMVVDPQCEGQCVVDLTYDGGFEMQFARAASLAALLGCLGWAALRRRRARRV
jgi:hypothetical protein